MWRRSRSLAGVVRLFRLYRRTGTAPTLVYTMGRVGSESLAEAARSAGGTALNVHFITSDGVRRADQWRREQGLSEPLVGHYRGLYARLLLTGRPGHRWEVLTCVRDPLAQALSSFFWVGERAGFIESPSFEGVELSSLRERFCAYFMDLSRRGPHGGVDWFEREFKPMTGINVFARPFDESARFAEYESERFKVLLVRYEDLEPTGWEEVRRFLRVTGDQEVPRRNLSRSGAYGELYETFRRKVRLPRWLLDHAYKSEMARHFYTPEEIAEFRRRWGEQG